MSNLSTLVGIIGGLAGIAIAVAILLKYISTGPGKREVIIRSSIIGVVIICIIALSGFISTSTTIIVHNPSVPSLGSSSVTETPTSTPSPTPTPQVISINQTMTCTDCSGTVNYSLMVKNATVNPTSGQVTMLIGVQNNTTSTNYLGFNFIKLQDVQTGATTDGTGDGFSEFIITANQLILVHPTFQFVPIVGRQYSLSTQMSLNDFTPINIKF